MKKIIKITLLTLFGAIFFATAIAAHIWKDEIRSLNSIKKVEGNKYLYVMDYYSEYDLDEVIAADIDNNAQLAEYVAKRVGKGLPIKIKSSQVASDGEEMQVFNCTSFQAQQKGGNGYYYGRNYDYFNNPTMVTYSHPKQGYASVAVSDMSHFGYRLDKLPRGLQHKVMCLASIYAPVDGMNEKGLCTSIMAIPHQPAQQSSGKHKVGTTVLMRLFLDRCATVDEALKLVDSLDICHDTKVGSGYHYMVADAKGDCAVIEFDKEDGWKTLVVRKSADTNNMLVTNHLLSPKYFTTEPDPAVGNPLSKSWWRYETVSEYLNKHNGTLTLEEAQEALKLVRWVDLDWGNGTIENTQYSNVYDQQAKVLYLRNWNSYETTNTFPLF